MQTLPGSIPQAALDRFVYVVGAARGGTSVFKASLDMHPNLMVLPGVSHFMNQVWRYRRKVHARLLSQIHSLPPFFDPDAAFEALSEKQRMSMWREVRSAVGSGRMDRMWSCYPMVWGLDPRFDKNPEGITAWVDKANDCRGLKNVRSAFPRGKFLFLFRDPRSSVLSLSRRQSIKAGGGKDDWSMAELVTGCIYWRNMAQVMLGFSQRHPESSLVVRFEDFVREPVENLARVFAFLELPEMSPDEVTSRLEGLAYTASAGRESGKGLSTAPLERWKQALPDKARRCIERLTGPTAVKAGYGMDTSTGPLRRLSFCLRVPGAKGRALALAKLAFLEWRERGLKA